MKLSDLALATKEHFASHTELFSLENVYDANASISKDKAELDGYQMKRFPVCHEHIILVKD